MTNTIRISLHFDGGPLDGSTLQQDIPTSWQVVRYEHVPHQSCLNHTYSGTRRATDDAVRLAYCGVEPLEVNGADGREGIVARMERVGVPIDVESRDALLFNWDRLKGRLVREIDKHYGVFIPTGQSRIDRTTKDGAAVVAVAEEWGVDPYVLSSMTKDVWNSRQQDEVAPAIVAARRAKICMSRAGGDTKRLKATAPQTKKRAKARHKPADRTSQ